MDPSCGGKVFPGDWREAPAEGRRRSFASQCRHGAGHDGVANHRIRPHPRAGVGAGQRVVRGCLQPGQLGAERALHPRRRRRAQRGVRAAARPRDDPRPRWWRGVWSASCDNHHVDPGRGHRRRRGGGAVDRPGVREHVAFGRGTPSVLRPHGDLREVLPASGPVLRTFRPLRSGSQRSWAIRPDDVGPGGEQPRVHRRVRALHRGVGCEHTRRDHRG